MTKCHYLGACVTAEGGATRHLVLCKHETPQNQINNNKIVNIKVDCFHTRRQIKPSYFPTRKSLSSLFPSLQHCPGKVTPPSDSLRPLLRRGVEEVSFQTARFVIKNSDLSMMLETPGLPWTNFSSIPNATITRSWTPLRSHRL